MADRVRLNKIYIIPVLLLLGGVALMLWGKYTDVEFISRLGMGLPITTAGPLMWMYKKKYCADIEPVRFAVTLLAFWLITAVISFLILVAW